jgi:methylmalonyl-CoA mutase N-terminal domain/subunit
MTITPTRQSEGGPRQSKPRASTESVSRVVNESGIEIKPLYTAQDVLATGSLDTSSPGEPPFTRGIHP